jgi:hypothetical protein
MRSNYKILPLRYAVSVNVILSTFNKRTGQLLPLHSTGVPRSEYSACDVLQAGFWIFLDDIYFTRINMKYHTTNYKNSRH